MKIGDRVVALKELWIQGDGENKYQLDSVGDVVDFTYEGVPDMVDVLFPEGLARGCDVGRHVELEVLVNSPLAKALK